jgi:folate-binding protein YgfZ
VVHAPVGEAANVWDALVARGARPVGMDALEGRRVELGIPRVGLDMGEKTLALELPVEAAISERKGCYLGQEVIARGTARGHVNRKLVAMLLEGPEPPPGAPLVRDGKQVGELSSIARAYGANALAALGMVRREWWDAGVELAVRHGHAVTIARVAALPLA